MGKFLMELWVWRCSEVPRKINSPPTGDARLGKPLALACSLASSQVDQESHRALGGEPHQSVHRRLDMEIRG